MTRYLVDSSIWIPILRGDRGLRDRVGIKMGAPSSLVTCGLIQAEIAAGRNAANAQAVDSIVRGLPALAWPREEAFIRAGDLFARARVLGRPVRSLNDCLIAVVVEQCEDVVLVHRDRDFDVLADLLGLEADRWDEG